MAQPAATSFAYNSFKVAQSMPQVRAIKISISGIREIVLITKNKIKLKLNATSHKSHRGDSDCGRSFKLIEWVSEWPSDGNLLEILAPEMKHALHSWPPDGNYSNDLAPF